MAIRRSWHLTGGNTWRTLAVLVLVAFIVSVVGSVLVRLLGVLVTDTIGIWLGDPLTVDDLVAAGVSVLLAPVAVVVQTALYFDLRVRRDGWDVPPPAADLRAPDDAASRQSPAVGDRPLQHALPLLHAGGRVRLAAAGRRC